MVQLKSTSFPNIEEINRLKIENNRINNENDQYIFSAISASLIIVEIIVNSFKHAFKNCESGKIKILLTKNMKNAIFRITDNGIGFNNKKAKINSFGMELIFTLVKQLYGMIEIKSNAGIEYITQFPI